MTLINWARDTPPAIFDGSRWWILSDRGVREDGGGRNEECGGNGRQPINSRGSLTDPCARGAVEDVAHEGGFVAASFAYTRSVNPASECPSRAPGMSPRGPGRLRARSVAVAQGVPGEPLFGAVQSRRHFAASSALRRFRSITCTPRPRRRRSRRGRLGALTFHVRSARRSAGTSGSAGARLGLRRHRRPVGEQRAPDVYDVRVEVDVAPAQPAHLTETETCYPARPTAAFHRSVDAAAMSRSISASSSTRILSCCVGSASRRR